jgi:hypothetical protein
MSWNTFFKITLLIIFAGMIFVIVFPKYQHIGGWKRGNIFTGQQHYYHYGSDKWRSYKH